MSKPKKPALVKKKRAGKPHMQPLPAIYELDERGKPRVRKDAPVDAKSATREAILGALAVNRGDNRLKADLHDVLAHAERFGENERWRRDISDTERSRAVDLVLWSTELRNWAEKSPAQKMPASYYLLRAIELGAALADAGVFYAKGSGGRKPGDGAHDNTKVFERALFMLEVLKLKPEGKMVWQPLAEEEIKAGRKSGKAPNVAHTLSVEYKPWRAALPPERVSIISNQMTCPTCGAKVHSDLH